MAPTLAIMMSLVSLLFISTGAYFLAKRFRIPYTVFLVIVGLALIPISKIPEFSFIASFKLTPDLLFFVFLPTLIFESAYNMNVRRMTENIRSISLLSVVSLLISTLFIAFGLFYGARWIGFPIPFEITLLFGTLISATDPVAVLALFKEYGAPKRLSLIFEGESLFNDGTSLALFLITLDILTTGWNGAESITEGIFSFFTMVVGGILFGMIMGTLFSKIIQYVKENQYIEITLTMIVAHFTFMFSELMTHHLRVAGHDIHISSIIATVVAAMVVGNYGRFKISPRVAEYMEDFWGYFAFVANSIVFILIGLLFASLPIDLLVILGPVLITIAVVMVARALSVYPVVMFLNWTKSEERIPLSWQHLMAWGSLRGALAVTMVLMIPDDFTIANWHFTEFTPKEFITAITIACIYFTLFIKATTIGPLLRFLKLDELNAVERIEHEQGRALVYARVLLEIERFRNKRYITEEVHDELRMKYEERFKHACANCAAYLESEKKIPESALLLYAVGVEKHSLHTLFLYNEINEPVYRKIYTDLSERQNKLERELHAGEVRLEHFRKDWLDRARDTFRTLLGIDDKSEEIVMLYTYYRARRIITRKVQEELQSIVTSDAKIYGGAIVSEVIAHYGKLEETAKEEADRIYHEHRNILAPLGTTFAESGIAKAEDRILEDLNEKEVFSPKVYALLKQELDTESTGVA
ncbi:MAG TPA: sodium:proton antiporter [Candidatus Paceibacterota bacterium]|nr:sodium:proton antiporter [Candidatus Paceibacterota bacterium]